TSAIINAINPSSTAGTPTGTTTGPMTARQLVSEPFATLLTVTLPPSLVNAGGFPAQLGLNWPAALVTSTVTVQLDAPAVTCSAVTVMAPPPAGAVVAAAALAHVPPTFGAA